MKRICECGRPAIVIPRGKRRRARSMVDHELCWRCWRALRAREAVKRSAPKRWPSGVP